MLSSSEGRLRQCYPTTKQNTNHHERQAIKKNLKTTSTGQAISSCRTTPSLACKNLGYLKLLKSALNWSLVKRGYRA
jgi:hypothetical protein